MTSKATGNYCGTGNLKCWPFSSFFHPFFILFSSFFHPFFILFSSFFHLFLELYVFLGACQVFQVFQVFLVAGSPEEILDVNQTKAGTAGATRQPASAVESRLSMPIMYLIVCAGYPSWEIHPIYSSFWIFLARFWIRLIAVGKLRSFWAFWSSARYKQRWGLKSFESLVLAPRDPIRP